MDYIDLCRCPNLVRKRLKADSIEHFTVDIIKVIKNSPDYTDSIVELVNKHGEVAEKAIVKYGDKAVEVLKNYGDDAVDGFKSGKTPDEIKADIDSAGDSGTGNDIGEEGGSKTIKPTGNIGDVPKGKYEVPDVNDPRPIMRQNETADLLALNGYVTEMLPNKKNGNGYGITDTSNPDFLIEGFVFDCYSPNTSNARNIRSTIKMKTEKQCSNIILNLDDCQISIDEILQAIKDEPIEGLDILMYVKDGKIYQVLGGE